jgi:Family of unknown function (DUF5522)
MTAGDDDATDEWPAAVRAAHDEAVASGAPGYVDPETGYLVFTTRFLRERGHCCGSGCRHCPYDEAARRAAGRPDSA